MTGKYKQHRKQWKVAHFIVHSRRKREADGFLRGVIVSNSISREEAAAFFKVGRYRYDSLRNLNPSLPIPSSNSRPNYHGVTAEEEELIRVFMKGQATEPGYHCQHRSIPVYMEDPNVTFASLYKEYKVECESRHARVLSSASFVRVVKFLMPTLHLGRTKTDTCEHELYSMVKLQQLCSKLSMNTAQ